MKTVRAVFEDGVFRPTEPPELPEHSVVEFEPRPLETDPVAPSIGLRDEDWPVTPEAIAQHLARMDRFESLEMTAAEEAEWEAARQARKDLEKSRFEEHAESLRKVWE